MFGWLHPAYEATAEIVVRPKNDIELLVEKRNAGDTSADDRGEIAQNISKMIGSRFFINEALREPSIKDHPLIRDQVDPEEFVAMSLKVEVNQPGLVVVKMTNYQDPKLCADMVNAIVAAYISAVLSHDRTSKSVVCASLAQHLDKLNSTYRQCMADLEKMRKALTPTDSGRWSRMELLKVEVEQIKLAAGRSHEKLLEVRLSDAEVCGNWDQENRVARFNRLEEEYKGNMVNLERSLELLAGEQHELGDESSGSYQLEMKQLEANRLQRHIDDISDMLARSTLLRESESRIEVFTEAKTPVSRRGWFD